MPKSGSSIVIAIAGGSGSGKTTLARALAERLGSETVVILSQDSYYLDQSARFDGDGGSVNFDHPSALDFALMAVHLADLRAGKAASVPIYDFATHTRKKESHTVAARPFVVVDGTLILSQPALVPLFDHRVFIDVPESVRFERRLKRDTLERGREAEGVRKQFQRQVAPMHDQFVQPSKAQAHTVLSYQDDLETWLKRLPAFKRILGS